MLSSYTRAINIQEKRTGSLFQQNSKAKCLTDLKMLGNTESYGLICFKYIHQNPLKAGLVKRIEDWEFSSFNDYAGLRNGDLSNKALCYELLEVPNEERAFMKFSYQETDEERLKSIF
jgi:hypothetical protein